MNSSEKYGEQVVSTRKELKPYVRPRISEIPLRPEEAVLGLCKTTSTAGPLQSACISTTTCSSAGS